RAAAYSGSPGGMRWPERISQCQIAQPRNANSTAPDASHTGWSLSNGDSQPAITALNTKLVNACSDDALPRWRGYMSRIASVRIGNTSATPKALSIIGSTAQGTAGWSTSRL